MDKVKNSSTMLQCAAIVLRGADVIEMLSKIAGKVEGFNFATPPFGEL